MLLRFFFFFRAIRSGETCPGGATQAVEIVISESFMSNVHMKRSGRVTFVPNALADQSGSNSSAARAAQVSLLPTGEIFQFFPR